MRNCHHCRRREAGAEVRLSYQSEPRWVCWACLAKLAKRRGRWEYGLCCRERPPYPDSVSCDCIYDRSYSTCQSSQSTSEGESRGWSHGTGVSETISESAGVSRTRSRTTQRLFSLQDPFGEYPHELVDKVAEACKDMFWFGTDGFTDGGGI